MSEHFRFARDGELPAAGRLAAHSFIRRGAEEHEQLLRQGTWGGAETVWVAEEEGRLAAMCQLLALRQWIGGVAVPTMGMALVAVAPTHRRRGLAGRLVASGMRAARERGDLATALYPFRVSFYQRLGYALAGETLQYRVPPEVIPDAPERAGVRLAEDAADLREVRDLYARWAPLQSGQLERTDAAWDRLLEGDGRAAVLYRGDGGTAEGYALVRYRVDLPPEQRFLEVQESAWLTDGARRGLQAWLGSLGDQWRMLVYRAHPAEPFGDRLQEPRLPPGAEPGWNLWFPSAVLLRGPMFRLLDVPGALRARPAFGRESLTVGLQVEDPQLPENSGAWRLRLDDGRPAVEPGASGADVTLAASVGALSRIYIGALTPSEAVAQGAVRVDRAELLPRLDSAFRVPRPWTFDGF